MIGHERQQELKKMAERFEEKIYTAATSLVRYACVLYILLQNIFIVFAFCFVVRCKTLWNLITLIHLTFSLIICVRYP